MKQVVILLIGLMVLSCTSTKTNSESESLKRSVICPMCGGTGTFEYIPGDIMTPREQCVGCNGTGMCTEEQARNIQGFMTPTHQSTGRSAQEIQYDLNKAYDLLADMERQYENCSSVTIAAQYPSMIQQQRERIQRFEEELRHASYLFEVRSNVNND